MQYVGWLRIESDPWADVISAHLEWMAWVATCAIYSDIPHAERIVLPEGTHPEGRKNAKEEG